MAKWRGQAEYSMLMGTMRSEAIALMEKSLKFQERESANYYPGLDKDLEKIKSLAIEKAFVWK